jgi:hypothetical protein
MIDISFNNTKVFLITTYDISFTRDVFMGKPSSLKEEFKNALSSNNKAFLVTLDPMTKREMLSRSVIIIF